MQSDFFYLQNSILFKWLEIYFLISIIIKGNSTDLAQKNSQSGTKINTIFRLSGKCINCLIINFFLKRSDLLWASKSCFCIRSFTLNNNSLEKKIVIQRALSFSFLNKNKNKKKAKKINIININYLIIWDC